MTVTKSFAQVDTWATYDSAQRYQEDGKLRLARILLERNISLIHSTQNPARHFLLLGSILEEEGYIPQTLEVYRKALDKVSPSAAPHEKGSALNGIALMEVMLGHYDSISYYLSTSRQLDTTIENSIRTDQIEGRYLQALNHYDKSLLVFQRALDKAIRLKDRQKMADILSSIGSIYFSHNPDMNVALKFFMNSNERCDSLQPSTVLIRNYGRIANAYMVLGNLKKAEVYLQKARLHTLHSENLRLKAYVLSSWAILLSEQGQIKEAADFSEEPMRIKREIGDQRQLQTDLLNVAEMRMKTGQYELAEKHLREGIAISRHLNDIIFLKYFYHQFSQLDLLRGDYRSAYADLKQSIVYKDSSFSVEHLRAVNEIKEKYEAEQREKIIIEKEHQIKEQKYQRTIIVGLFITTVLILFVILILVRTKHRNKLHQEKQLRLQTIVQTQEEVQQRIARDLHDGLVQVLGAAKLALESIRDDSNPSQLRKQMNLTSGILDEAVTEARSISHQILPYSLLKGGLEEALEELLIRSFQTFEFNRPDKPVDISETEAINIYRIVQELVNNASKHAEATKVILTSIDNKHQLLFTFEDNGIGFVPSSTYSGAGISNIKTRSELIGGSVSFHSIPSKGTRIELILPR